MIMAFGKMDSETLCSPPHGRSPDSSAGG